MFKIAIVDDKPSDAEYLKSLLSSYPQFKDGGATIDFYDNPINFLDHFKKLYDIIFLDINMPLMNGLELGRRIKDSDDRSNIIFTTSYASLAINGYEINAFDFLVKPIKQKDLFASLDRLVKRIMEKNTAKIAIRIKHGYKAIAARDIYYVEVVRHELIVHCTDEQYSFRGVLKNIEQELGDGFAKCSICYLVNLDYVDSISGDEVLLPNGIHLPISRSKKQEFTEKFLERIS